MGTTIRKLFVVLASLALLTINSNLSTAFGQTVQPIYYFTNGDSPFGNLTLGPDGNFYGTTELGGTNGDGTVFKVTTNGVLTTLATFAGTNGANPYAGLTLGTDDNFYGTTYNGGSSSNGTIFKVTSSGVLSTLISFAGTNGANPSAGLALGLDGNFYGTTYNGGGSSNGTVFKMTSSGVLTTLHSFTALVPSPYSFETNYDGKNPEGTLTPGADGNFYGTAVNGGTDSWGTVFEVTTNGALTTLVNFTGANGAHPFAGLTPGPNGIFYGTTVIGGIDNYGSVFKVTTNGVLTSLASFAFTNGWEPIAGLSQGLDGNFYGTTYLGPNYGSIFDVTTNGALTMLVNLAGTNGWRPYGALTLGPDGNFYGTTSQGGTGGGGEIYRLLLPPEIIQQPSSQFAAIGNPASFSVTLFGTAPYSFQWLSNNIPIAGGTNSTLTVPYISSAGNYSVIVTNNWGSITSSVANLQIGQSPNIASQPANETLPIGNTASFGVSATGSSPLFYQWYFTNAPIAGATNAGLVFGPALTNQSGSYQVIVTNQFGSATSAVATLTVVLEPNIYGLSNNPSAGLTTVYLASNPGSTNYLYASTNLNPANLTLPRWQIIATNVASSNGLFQFIDPATKGIPAKYYWLADQLIAVPVINSISTIEPLPTQTITISGQGFGNLSPYNGDSNFLVIHDNIFGPLSWEAGFTYDQVTLNVTSWTDSQIVISGFTGAYGSDLQFLNAGDTLLIGVGNPQTGYWAEYDTRVQ